MVQTIDPVDHFPSLVGMVFHLFLVSNNVFIDCEIAVLSFTVTKSSVTGCFLNVTLKSLKVETSGI